MRELPILFSASMVRAILDGRKAQTRRIVKPQPTTGTTRMLNGLERDDYTWWPASESNYTGGGTRCPYGVTGDRLWVRETWQYADWTENGLPWIRYASDGSKRLCERIPDEWADRLTATWADLSEPDNVAIDGLAADRAWRPSIFLPRWASRLTLEVTAVRVERLQAITDDDAIAEGARRFDDLPSQHHPYGRDARWSMLDATSTDECLGTARFAFASLWNSINPQTPWESNPWVWVVEFARVDTAKEPDHG